MKRVSWFCSFFGLIVVLAAGPAEARGPLRDVLGIVPGMTEDEAHRRLARVGAKPRVDREATEKKVGKEIWSLDHPRFTYVSLIVDREKKVQYVQGYLRKDRKPLRYGDIGNLKRARQAGHYIYFWDLPARGDQPALQVQARGADPRIAGSYSVVSPSSRMALAAVR